MRIPQILGNDAHASTVVPRPFFLRPGYEAITTPAGVGACARGGLKLYACADYHNAARGQPAISVWQFHSLVPRPSPSSTRAHALYVLIMRRWFFGGRRPEEVGHVSDYVIDKRNFC